MADEPVFPQLVNGTFTVQELALMSAGLIAARRQWAGHAQEATMLRNESQKELALKRIEQITMLLERISGMTTDEQKQQEMRSND